MDERLITAAEMRKLTGVKTSRLRYLHETGRVIPERVTTTGYRYYRQDQVIDVLREERKQMVVAYNSKVCINNQDNKFMEEAEQELKSETEKLAEEVGKYITDIEIVPIYDWWSGDIDKSNMMYVIKQAAKGLVIRIIVMDKEQFIAGDYKEFKRWFGYLGCELLDMKDLKQREMTGDADQGNKRNN